MMDLVDAVRTYPGFDRLEIGELLFAYYTCPLREKHVAHWSHMDHLVHVLSGRKTWHTASGAWLAEPGDTLFFKKGAAVVEQDFDAAFCVMIIFIPDEFVRSVVRELAAELSPVQGTPVVGEAMRVNEDAALSGFFHSMRAYFASAEKPPPTVLKLKLKEVVVSVLTSRCNVPLAHYFHVLAARQLPSLPEIMEANFRHNLELDDFARLCRRSRSSFKREFQNHYGQPPGRWLLGRRLEHALTLLEKTALSITEIVFECGFEEASHFTKCFKSRFGQTPSSFRSACENRI